MSNKGGGERSPLLAESLTDLVRGSAEYDEVDVPGVVASPASSRGSSSGGPSSRRSSRLLDTSGLFPSVHFMSGSNSSSAAGGRPAPAGAGSGGVAAAARRDRPAASRWFSWLPGRGGGGSGAGAVSGRRAGSSASGGGGASGLPRPAAATRRRTNTLTGHSAASGRLPPGYEETRFMRGLTAGLLFNFIGFAATLFLCGPHGRKGALLGMLLALTMLVLIAFITIGGAPGVTTAPPNGCEQ